MVQFLTCHLCFFKTLQLQTIISLSYLKNTFTLVEQANAANKISTKCRKANISCCRFIIDVLDQPLRCFVTLLLALRRINIIKSRFKYRSFS